MNVYLEIAKALIEMVKQGGTYAIWGVFIWMFLGIVKIGVIMWAVCWVFKTLTQAFTNYHFLKLLHRKDTYTLLTPKVSKRLEASLKEFQESTSQAMKGFITESQNLLKQSKNPTQ